ncbi:hypothetical protein P885DRAFT_25882 [Corynascus similis CBS 632.67]
MLVHASRARGSVIPIAILLACSWLLVLHSRVCWDWLPFAAQEPPVEVVVASVSTEDTTWVHRFLPDWARSVYIVDDPSAKLTVPQNKGREAMVYLSHIVTNYDTLAETTVFVHASRFAWHNDNPDYDILPALRNLNLAYVQARGYVNLRCVQVLGCPIEIRPHVDAASDWERSVGAARSGRPLTTKEIYKQAFQELMPGVQVPDKVGVSCCSQFAVSREAVHSRPKEDYVRWRDWLLDTPLADDLSGRVFEYLWHSKYSLAYDMVSPGARHS